MRGILYRQQYPLNKVFFNNERDVLVFFKLENVYFSEFLFITIVAKNLKVIYIEKMVLKIIKKNKDN